MRVQCAHYSLSKQAPIFLRFRAVAKYVTCVVAQHDVLHSPPDLVTLHKQNAYKCGTNRL